MDSSLYGGFTGVAWAIAHLRGRLLSPGELETEAIDQTLEKYVSRRGWRLDYDLIVGLVGLGVYALELLPSGSATSCLEGVIDRLEELAVPQGDGITWHTAPRLLPPQQLKENPRGYYNLGLAHGVPGVIALLGAACAAGVRCRRARKLLDGAVSWLLAQRITDRPGASFPPWITPGVVPTESARSAWCYGDPGIAAGLFCAARSVEEKAWETEAVAIAQAAAQRLFPETRVLDATLCHGAAGLAHIYNRISQATGDEVLRRAARTWFERALGFRRPGRGIGGFSFRSVRRDGTPRWLNDLGILTGASGIALALLAAATPIEPEWDRMLLLSTPISR
jgi:hypothetical protein